jgi:hypothetical protein
MIVRLRAERRGKQDREKTCSKKLKGESSGSKKI